MSQKELPNPRFTIWKYLWASLYLWAVFIFFGWLLKFVWESDKYVGFHSDPPTFPSLTVGDILFGSVWLPLYLWLYWSWKPGRKHARWHRWLGSLIGSIYLSILVLSGGMTSWNVLLTYPWNWIVNSILAVLLLIAWILPAMSYRWSQTISRAQDALYLRILAFGGVEGLMITAGILGANYGMNLSRNADFQSLLLIFAFTFPFLAILVAQYNATRLWPYRPWAKDEE